MPPLAAGISVRISACGSELKPNGPASSQGNTIENNRSPVLLFTAVDIAFIALRRLSLRSAICSGVVGLRGFTLTNPSPSGALNALDWL